MGCAESFMKNSYVKELYERAAESDGVYSRLVTCLPAGGTVLEVGGGVGHFSNFCRSFGFRVISSDLSLLNMHAASKQYPGLRVCAVDAERLPFKTGSLDAVVSLELVEHLYNQRAHLLEVRRVLKCGGVYVVKTPNKLYDRLVNFPYLMLVKGEKYSDLAAIHPTTRMMGGLSHILRECGFRVGFCTLGHLSKTQVRKAGRLSGLAGQIIFRLLPLSLQPSLVCVAVKNGRGTV